MPEAASAAFPLVACERRMQGMKLKRSNPHLKSGKAREFMLWQSAKSSSAVEGIAGPDRCPQGAHMRSTGMDRR